LDDFKEEGWYCINVVNGAIVKIDKPNEPLYTFSGALGDKVMLTDCKTNEQRVLYDWSQVKRNKLNYPPNEIVDERNSLKLWKQVNKAIEIDDMSKADILKREIEDGQRTRRKEKRGYFKSNSRQMVHKIFSDFKLGNIHENKRSNDTPLHRASCPFHPEFLFSVLFHLHNIDNRLRGHHALRLLRYFHSVLHSIQRQHPSETHIHRRYFIHISIPNQFGTSLRRLLQACLHWNLIDHLHGEIYNVLFHSEKPNGGSRIHKQKRRWNYKFLYNLRR